MSAPRNNIWTPTYFPRLTTAHETPFLIWWYRLTTPQTILPTAGFRAQEAQRRSRLLSNIVLTEILLLLGTIIFTSLNGFYSIAGSQSTILGILCLALWLNRQGNRAYASWLVVVVSELSVIITITFETWLFKSSALSIMSLCYLLIPEIIAACLLPMSSVLALIIIDLLLTISVLFLAPQNTILGPQTCSGLLFGITSLFLVAGYIGLLWRRNTAFIIAHADSVEVVAALEHTMAEQEHMTAQHKRELDESINRLMQTHLRVANGEYDVRVPIEQQDELWPIAGSLNTLLSRIQRLGQLAQKLEKTEQEAARLAAALRALRTGNPPVSLQRSGTAIDLILIELATTVEIQTETVSEE